MLYLPLRTVEFILKEFEKKLYGYTIQTLNINDFEKILLIEDSLALSLNPPIFISTVT